LAFGCIGTITETPDFVVRGISQNVIGTAPVVDLKTAWEKTFGALI
jgi:hypothetical protein